ncbi:hypothetical protein Cni_G10551 [Canna indica]|uniref:Uncharacterized protein n=1 Tax=Canna indica TaxID=4628 RepID=A0AAQ3K5Y8_9LILI|nr:hypothetical protein Cni_G10551 [Canna indica]
MKEFNHKDIYRQMEIVCYKGRFTVKPMASDGIPSSMLRKDLGRQRSPSLLSAGVVLAIDEGKERWQRGGGKVEQIGACESAYGAKRVAEVQSVMRVEAAYLNGKEANCFDTHDVDELVWFKMINSVGGRESVVKLSYSIWEGIKWEESRVRCNGGGDEKVERVGEYRGGAGTTRKFRRGGGGARKR